MKKIILNPYVIGIGIMALIFAAVYFTSFNCLNYTK